jgi:hypothetical protein
MGGAHRSTTQSGMVSARKSAVWLSALAAVATVILALLALLAFVIYLAITYQASHPTPAWVAPVAIAVLSALWIFVLGDLGRSLLHKQARSPARRRRMIRGVLLPLGTTLMLFGYLGQHYGWWKEGGAADSAVTWTGCALYLGVTLIWLMQEHHVLPALRARVAARRRPSG